MRERISPPAGLDETGTGEEPIDASARVRRAVSLAERAGIRKEAWLARSGVGVIRVSYETSRYFSSRRRIRSLTSRPQLISSMSWLALISSSTWAGSSIGKAELTPIEW